MYYKEVSQREQKGRNEMNLKDRIEKGQELLAAHEEKHMTLGEAVEICEIGSPLRAANNAYNLGALAGYELRTEQEAQSLEAAFPGMYDNVKGTEITRMRDFLHKNGFETNDFDLISAIAAIYKAGIAVGSKT